MIFDINISNRAMDHSASLYRRGSDYEDNDGKGELKKVAFLGSHWSENMTGVVLALDRLGPGSEDYLVDEEKEEHVGKEEE